MATKADLAVDGSIFLYIAIHSGIKFYFRLSLHCKIGHVLDAFSQYKTIQELPTPKRAGR